MQRHVAFILAFSGAYLFGITIVHLLPQVFHDQSPIIAMWIIGGFTLQLFLDFLSRGVEHGHMHIHQRVNRSLVFSIMAGLSIHALLEGIPLGAHQAAAHTHGGGFFHVPLLMGIALHKIPAAFALIAIFGTGGIKRSTCILCLVIFSLMSPIAYVLTDLAVHKEVFLHHFLVPVLALVAGSFMHISTTIIFEADAHGHRIRLGRIFAVLMGLVLAAIPLVL
jgi:zinc transporter ZupT